MKLPVKLILNLLSENLLRLRKFELIGLALIFSFFLFFSGLNEFRSDEINPDSLQNYHIHN